MKDSDLIDVALALCNADAAYHGHPTVLSLDEAECPDYYVELARAAVAAVMRCDPFERAARDAAATGIGLVYVPPSQFLVPKPST